MAKPTITEITGLKDKANEGFTLVTLGFLDFVGDPARVCNSPYESIEITGSSDLELNGLYDAVSPEFVSLSPISHTSENSNTVTASLSGLITFDDALMTLLGTRSNWVGRDAIFWYTLYDAAAQVIGTPWRHYTGRMINVSFGGTGSEGTVDEGTIEVIIENYLASLSEASNRSYMSQQDFDPGDLSAAASIAAVNHRNPLSTAPFAIGSPAARRDFLLGETIDLQ